MFNLKLLIPLMLLVACAEAPIVKPVKTGHEGEGIPKLSLLLMDKKSFFNTADLPKGKTNVLFYFSPTCPHCRVQIRTIVNNMDKLKNIQFTVLTIADYANTKSFYDRYNLGKYSNIVVGIDTGFIFSKYFKTTKVPFIAIYRRGILEDAFIGSMGFYQLKQIVKSKSIAQSLKCSGSG